MSFTYQSARETFTLKKRNGITYLHSEPLYKILFDSLFVTLLLHSVTVTSCFSKIDMNVYKILTIFLYNVHMFLFHNMNVWEKNEITVTSG